MIIFSNSLVVKEGALGFSVLWFWLLFRSVFSVFAPKNFGFGVHCGLRIFRFLALGFRFSRKILTGFPDAVFGFSYLTYLGSGFSSI